MFDYVMFLSYGSLFFGLIFFIKALAGVAYWYYYENTPTGRLDYVVNYTMKGYRITSWCISKNLTYAAICALLYFSIK